MHTILLNSQKITHWGVFGSSATCREC